MCFQTVTCVNLKLFSGLGQWKEKCKNRKTGMSEICGTSWFYVTCSAPVSDFAWLPADLPALLQEVSQCQHASSTQGVGEQQVPTLEKRPPEELYTNQEVFTCLGKHDVWTAENKLSSAEEKQLAITFCY